MIARAFERLYAFLLYAYPPDLRRTHGADMRQCARATLATRGAAAVPRLVADLSVSVPREWTVALSDLSLKGLLMNGTGRDVAYAMRLLWRSPGFTLAAVLTLALGIGANAAIFSLADATLLRPLKVANGSELYMIKFSSAYPDYRAYTERQDLFNGVVGTSGARLNAVADGQAELVDSRFVSGNYFGVLGVSPAAGRLLGPADDVPNGPILAVLGYRWWQTRFGGDPSVIGKAIRVNNAPVTIIGVAAKDFRGTSLYEATKLFLPITQTPRVQTGFFSRPEMLTNRGMVWINVIARLKPGVTPPAAAAGIEAVYRQFHPLRPGSRPDPFELTPLRTRALGGTNESSVYRFVGLLGGVVALTLLIGCANLANLLLSRAAARRREIGVRMAIGAGRGRIARQLLIESLLLSTIGGAAGLYVAAAGLHLLARFQLPGGIEIDSLDLRLSGAALAFTAIVTGATGLLFGLAPAWRASQTDVLGSLRDESRATSAQSGVRSTLVAAQVALSLVLLIGTGLFLRSLGQSLRVPLGFRVDGVATASVNLGAARYDVARAAAFYDEALARVRRIPAVTAASWSTVMPILGSRVFTAKVEGYQPQADEDVRFYNAAVGPEYFQAAGTRLLRGRVFTSADSASAALVGIVNEAAVRKYWQGRDPLQGRLAADRPDVRSAEQWIQIVGVVEDAKVEELDEEPIPYVYLPFAQERGGGSINAAHLFVRTGGDADALLGPVSEQLGAIDRDAPVYDVSTFAWRVRQLVMPQRMGVVLFGVFSALALTLAAIGIYGVASYVAALRTRELGIRIALGADRARIRALVLRQGSVPVAGGLAAGLAIAAGGSQVAAAFLRGVPPRDPMTYAVVATLLAAIALAATWIPARRAAELDPIRALRQD
jgi:putative ABC transport system permease protein